MQFSMCAPTIYFKILRPSKFTSTLRTIVHAAVGNRLLQIANGQDDMAVDHGACYNCL